jgi:hypothetical protein
MSQTLIATIGFLGGAAAALVDGRRAVGIAALLVGLSLTPAAASIAGAPAAGVAVGAGVLALVLDPLARRAAERIGAVPGLDPLVPVVAPRDALFGPRSVRAAAAALALVAASWVSLNVLVGAAGSAQGAVFAVAYIWLVGAARLIRARALEDLLVGAAAVAVAGAVAWILEAGSSALPEAMAAAGLAPAAAVTAGWLQGRHHRPALVVPVVAAVPLVPIVPPTSIPPGSDVRPEATG